VSCTEKKNLLEQGVEGISYCRARQAEVLLLLATLNHHKSVLIE
jgi:hypothetical protein